MPPLLYCPLSIKLMATFSSVKQQFMAGYIEKLNKREREILEELKHIKVSRMYALAAYTSEDSKA